MSRAKGKTIRTQLYLDSEVNHRILRLADSMRMTKSKVLTFLLKCIPFEVDFRGFVGSIGNQEPEQTLDKILDLSETLGVKPSRVVEMSIALLYEQVLKNIEPNRMVAK